MADIGDLRARLCDLEDELAEIGRRRRALNREEAILRGRILAVQVEIAGQTQLDLPATSQRQSTSQRR